MIVRQFPWVVEDLMSSSDLVGIISTYPGTSPTPRCQVMAKAPEGILRPSTIRLVLPLSSHAPDTLAHPERLIPYKKADAALVPPTREILENRISSYVV